LQADIQQHLLQRGSIGLRESKIIQKQHKANANAGKVKNKAETKPEHFTLSNDKRMLGEVDRIAVVVVVFQLLLLLLLLFLFLFYCYLFCFYSI
jgi:hypothetical protein